MPATPPVCLLELPNQSKVNFARKLLKARLTLSEGYSGIGQQVGQRVELNLRRNWFAVLCFLSCVEAVVHLGDCHPCVLYALLRCDNWAEHKLYRSGKRLTDR